MDDLACNSMGCGQCHGGRSPLRKIAERTVLPRQRRKAPTEILAGYLHDVPDDGEGSGTRRQSESPCSQPRVYEKRKQYTEYGPRPGNFGRWQSHSRRRRFEKVGTAVDLLLLGRIYVGTYIIVLGVSISRRFG